MKSEHHLVDDLNAIRLDSPRAEYVGLERMTIHGDTRSVLFQHPPSTVTFPAYRVDAQARLLFALGIRQTAWTRIESAIIFRIHRQGRFGQRQCLFEFRLDPAREPGHRAWLEFEIDVPPGARLRLVFSTATPEGASSAYAWAGWADPRLTGLRRPPLRQPVRRAAPDVILITSDALRPDFLGCYGHPEIATPHIDQIASEGWVFTEARTPSPSTYAAYASLASGQHPASLGVNAEWGQLPPGSLGMVGAFATGGYQTVMAASEVDHDRMARTDRSFEVLLPLLGRPDQDGAVTTRRLLAWLEQADDRPRFVWIQYFDTHPPPRLPREYAHPSSEQRQAVGGDASGLPGVHGVESLLEMVRALPRLHSGIPDYAFAVRLRATADALETDSPHGPDLAAHLHTLALVHPEDRALRIPAAVLRSYADSLEAGSVPHGLVAWLESLVPYLREIEAELLLGLDDLSSLDQAVRRCWAQVRYLDHHVGELLAGLKAIGRYAESTIILTSPHGEGFGEHGVIFHHHALLEACLRVPLLWRPPVRYRKTADARGGRILGQFSLLDLPATLLDAHDLPRPAGMESKSHWREIQDGGTIELHDCFMLGPYGTQAAIVRGEHKLIYSFRDHWTTPDWQFRKGETRLFALDDLPADTRDLSAKEPALARELTGRLLQWARGNGIGSELPTGRDLCV